MVGGVCKNSFHQRRGGYNISVVLPWEEISTTSFGIKKHTYYATDIHVGPPQSGRREDEKKTFHGGQHDPVVRSKSERRRMIGNGTFDFKNIITNYTRTGPVKK